MYAIRNCQFFEYYNVATAGEILLNCINKVEYFSEVSEKTKAEAALAAGIFHREELPIEAVKEHMRERGIETR